jgi:hypothetical protein
VQRLNRFVAVIGCLLLLALLFIGCGGASGNTPQLPVEDTTPCMYDPDADAYKECMMTDVFGNCMSFGIGCAPPGNPPCMYDSQSDTYRECFHVTADGKCAHYGSNCEPQ